jgi:Uma2 family endonuclease
MSAVLEFTQEPPREVWLISRYEPRKRKRVLLTPEDEEKILSSSEYEIVNGELYERPLPNPEHSRIQLKLGAKLLSFVEENDLGMAYTECHYELAMKLTRVPDVAFVSFDRFPESGEPKDSRWRIPPDLAVEIVSPNDIWQEVYEKIDDYLRTGVKQVWVISPEQKILSVYRSRKDVTILTEEDDLISKDVLPGFHLKLSELFRQPKRK